MKLANRTFFPRAALTASMGIFALSRASAQTASETTELDVSLSGSVESTSNAFLNSAETSDVIYRVTPEVSIARVNGLFSLAGSAGVTATRYQDFSDLYSTDPFASLDASYAGKPLSATASVGYVSQIEASGIVGDVLDTSTSSFGGNVDYYLSSAAGLSGGVAYNITDPKDDVAYGETTVFSANAGVFYEYSSALRFNLGLLYSESQVDRLAGTGNDSEDFGVSLGMTGQLLPTVTGTAAVGAKQRTYKLAGLDDETSPYTSLGATWTLNGLTSVELFGSYDYSTSVANLSNNTATFTASLNHDFTSQLGGEIGFTLEESTLTDAIGGERDDSAYLIFSGLSYALTDWGEIGLGLSYGERDSDLAIATYEVFTATLSASIFF